jgi:regulator of protease activity HflC (stomatin/prohibitin superfamily)
MDEQTKQVRNFIISILIGLVGLIVVFGSFTIVSPQEKGVVTRLGSISRVLDNGFHFKLPLIESVTKMDVQIQALPVTELAYSKDSQTVETEVTLNYRLDPSLVEQVYKDVKRDYQVRIVIPAIKESIKSVTANYTAQGLIDNRAKISSDVKTVITERITGKGFLVDSVSITNLNFDDAYEEAIKQKQVAEQKALAQVNVTKQEEEIKKQEILKAEALAEKTRLESQALASQQGEKVINKIYAEAALEAAKKWNGQLPNQMIPGATLPFIQLGK